MKTIKNILMIILGLPVGLVITAVVGVAASLLWLVFLPWKFINLIFKRNSENLQTFEEFIFACYGFAAICTLVPLMILDDTMVD